MIELSDELLMAYIDGQLDKPNEKVVREILERDDSQGVRVRRLQDSQAKFLDLFGALVRDGAAAPMRNPARGGRASRPSAAQEPSGMATAGVAALLLIIGASLGFTIAYYTGIGHVTGEELSLSMRPANWSEDIAELHAYFTPEALTTGRDSQSNADVVRFQLAKLPHAVNLPDFSQSGLRFVRGQTLSYRGNRLMQLVYTGKSDPLVALYITAGEEDHPISPGRFGDVQTVSWSENGLRFLIAADMTQEALRALAAVAQSQLGKS